MSTRSACKLSYGPAEWEQCTRAAPTPAPSRPFPIDTLRAGTPYSRVHPLEPVTLSEIVAARDRVAGAVVRTPLVRLNVETDTAIYLKLENLQPIGSFKLRGAGNALRKMDSRALQRGVYTASAGNMAQGLAWAARELGITCRVVVPDRAPKAKLDAIHRGAVRRVVARHRHA